MTRVLVYGCLCGLLTLAAVQARATASSFPTLIPLPDGFGPEGIAVGRGTDFFVGSLVTGAIYKGALGTGEGAILVSPSQPRIAVGLSLDGRSNYLHVAGGFSGQGYVYEADTGAEVGVFQLTTAPVTLINDVVVTRQNAYFTDSWQPYLYRLPLDPGGRLPENAIVEEIPLGGDFFSDPAPQSINANGIEATADGQWLLVINYATGRLYRVDPYSGYALEVDLGGGSLPVGDGLLLEAGGGDRYTLYVVQNLFNQIAVVHLDGSLLAGEIVDVITSPDFRIPTTVAGFGQLLYAVNARFDAAPPGNPPPDLEFEVVAVPKP